MINWGPIIDSDIEAFDFIIDLNEEVEEVYEFYIPIIDIQNDAYTVIVEGVADSFMSFDI